MSIKSLGYIGVNATELGKWKDFACNVMGLEDTSASLGDEATHYYKMDDHPYRVFPVASPAPIITAENFDKSFIKVFNIFIPLYKIAGENESRLYL